mgnify:CR=1 FL=1
MTKEFDCPLEEDKHWNPPERDIKAACYVVPKANTEQAEIKIPASPTAFVRSDEAHNLEDWR